MARPRLNGVQRAKSGRISRSRSSLLQRGQLVHDGYVVYFAKTDDLVKIGYSGATRNRVADLSFSKGKPVRVLGLAHVPSAETARKLEAKMHEIFASKRVEGEWFDLTMSDVLSALAMCRSVGIHTTGGEDASADSPILSGLAYGSDHSVA